MIVLQAKVIVDKRKKIIRNAAVIFISIIVLLTFFSKTINNFLLPEVECKSATSGNLTKEITSQGEVFPLNIETINSHGTWNIAEVKVQEGENISKGDVLAVIDLDDVKLEIKKMELNLLKMENDLKLYKNGLQTIDLDLYQNDVESARKAVEKAEKSLKNQKELYANDAVALEIVNEAEEKLDIAKRDYEEKQKLLKQKEERSINAGEDYKITVQEKEAVIEVGRLELDNKKKNTPGDGIIQSPLDGIVKSILIESGVTANSGQALFEIVKKESGISINWTLEGKASDEVVINDPVDFTAGKFEKINFSGTVKCKKYSAKEGTYEYIADIKEAIDEIEIGQKVDVSIKKSSKNYSVIVPNSSVINEGLKPYVYILRAKNGIMGEENYVQKVEVNVVETNDFYSALSGASILDDDKIVVFSTKPLYDKIQVKLR